MQTLSQLRSGNLANAKHLKLSENLEHFPEEVFLLSDTLEVLDLSNNQLSDLPEDLSRFSKLKILFLSNNRFRHIPESISHCKALSMLSFKHNRLEKLSSTCLPPDLRWLILTDNKLEQLPDNFGDLIQMEKLALAGNRLKSLPLSMEKMQKLGLLRISANKLTEFPNLLLKLPELAWLAFAGNPFCAARDQHNDSLYVARNDLTLHEVLGRGASGVIYRASWNHNRFALDDEVAVKVFHGEVTSDGYPEDELDACLSVEDHPNIVSALARVEEPDFNALIMKLIPSHYGNLGQPPSLESCTRDVFTQGQSFTQDVANNYIAQMTRLVEHLEAAEICHGDLYAHNTLVGEEAHLLFGDFGAASKYHHLGETQKAGIRRIERRSLAHFIDDIQSIVDRSLAVS